MNENISHDLRIEYRTDREGNHTARVRDHRNNEFYFSCPDRQTLTYQTCNLKTNLDEDTIAKIIQLVQRKAQPELFCRSSTGSVHDVIKVGRRGASA